MSPAGLSQSQLQRPHPLLSFLPQTRHARSLEDDFAAALSEMSGAPWPTDPTAQSNLYCGEEIQEPLQDDDKSADDRPADDIVEQQPRPQPTGIQPQPQSRPLPHPQSYPKSHPQSHPQPQQQPFLQLHLNPISRLQPHPVGHTTLRTRGSMRSSAATHTGEDPSAFEITDLILTTVPPNSHPAPSPSPMSSLAQATMPTASPDSSATGDHITPQPPQLQIPSNVMTPMPVVSSTSSFPRIGSPRFGPTSRLVHQSHHFNLPPHAPSSGPQLDVQNETSAGTPYVEGPEYFGPYPTASNGSIFPVTPPAPHDPLAGPAHHPSTHQPQQQLNPPLGVGGQANGNGASGGDSGPSASPPESVATLAQDTGEIDVTGRLGRNRVFNACAGCGAAKHIRANLCKQCRKPKGPPVPRKKRQRRR